MPIIEAGEIDWIGLDLLILKYLDGLFVKSQKIDTIILGCTHYAIIEERIKKYLPENIRVVSQGRIIAEKLSNYLERHPEMENRLEKDAKRIFFTTEDSAKIRHLVRLFYNKSIEMKLINLEVRKYRDIV